MKQKQHLSGKKEYFLSFSLFVAALLLFFTAGAQPKKKIAKTDSTANVNNVTTMATMSKVVPSMAEYAKTPQAAKRRQQYGKNFGNNGKDSMKIKYADGTSLTLRMIKHPRFGNQPTSITPKLTTDKKKPPEKSTDSKGQQWTCTTDHVQLTATSTTFLNNDYSSSASHIYPGACYTFEDFYNGSYKETTGDRNPIVLVTDNTNIKGSSYVTINNPDMGTVFNGVKNLFRESVGKAATESMTYQIYETANDADQSIKISGGASGYGISLSAGYSNSSESKTYNLTIDAIKTLFSITTTPPDNGFFKDPKVESTPNLMVIGSVSYGVRVLANMSVTFTSQQEEVDFKAAYSGWGVSANVDLGFISNNKSVSSTINCYVVGGPGNSTVSFNKKDLKNEIERIIAGATYQNAKPVKYEFYDMAGNVIGSRSATDNFAVRNCTPGKDDPRLESVTVDFGVGSSNKNANDNYTLLLWPGNYKINNNYAQNGDMVFEYNQLNSPEAGLEYQSNANYTIKMQRVNRPATLSEFTKNGGELELSLFPIGGNGLFGRNDNWTINAMTVTLNFEGDVGGGKSITFKNIYIDQNSPHRVLYFDSGFNAK